MATIKYTYEKIIETLKRTGSIWETAKELGCSRGTVHHAQAKYNQNTDIKLKFSRGGFNRQQKEITSINDLPPVAFKIVKCFKRNPNAKKSEIAELCNTSAVYVSYVIKRLSVLNIL
jgi:DNA-directed RNA polymerase specialized sigma subunit